MDRLAVSRIPVKDMVCTAPEEIMRKLVVQWFETIKKNSQGQQCGLADYTIDALVILKNTDTPQYDIVATAGYRVKPGRLGDCGWFTGNIGKDGWIRTYDGFGVYRENGYFRLTVLHALGV